MISITSRPIRILLDWPRFAKRLLALGVDLCLSGLSVWFAFYLRLGYFVPLGGDRIWVILGSLLFLPSIFISCGVYKNIFRYSGLKTMMSLCWANLFYGVAFASVFTLWSIDGVPRTVGLIQPAILSLLIFASRAAVRIWFGGIRKTQNGAASVPQALIYGAGQSGRQLAAAMVDSCDIRVVGFLDDNEHLQGNLVNGLPVYNPVDLFELCRNLLVTDVLLALPKVSRQRRNEILGSLKVHKLAVRTLPVISDLAIGKVSFSDVRDLDIDDLLGREPVKPNDFLLGLNTHGRVVMVTGAGGSIGSELCRQILNSYPKKILLIDICEFALYQIHQELVAIIEQKQSGSLNRKNDVVDNLASTNKSSASKVWDVEIVPLLASVCDEGRITRIMNTWKPNTVYHAAAFKHVPMVEHNVSESVRNNIWGTRTCANAARLNSVRNFVLISTDKAVRPTNIMGASKRVAEMVVQALADDSQDINDGAKSDPSVRTIFSIVRFGNVLGSSGSVLPMFREQVNNGGPITLTHVDITRYFMSIPEAAQLVIQAGAMGQGGDVFVLDMGQPVKISDLARRIVEMSGLTVRDNLHPEGDIDLLVTGLRPGEKLYEELLICDKPESTEHSKIMKAHEEHLGWQELEILVKSMMAAISLDDVVAIRRLLQEIVNGYQPSSEIVDWVYLARNRLVVEKD